MGEEASSFNVKLKDSFCLFCLGLRQDRLQGLGAHPGEWGRLPKVVDFWSGPNLSLEEEQKNPVLIEEGEKLRYRATSPA